MAMDLPTLLNLATLGAVSLGGYLATVAKAGFEARVKTSVEESVKIAVHNVNWAAELSQELEKARGTERQELRFKSYAHLWHELRPLAIYDAAPFDRKMTAKLSVDLSNWYFSLDGGLMLTTPVRDLYFALQDLLHAISSESVAPWQGERAPDPKHAFEAVAQRMGLGAVLSFLGYLKSAHPELALSSWPRNVEPMTRAWGDDLKRLAGQWAALAPFEQFAALQQAGSVLRTAMTCDVESRLR